MSAAMIGIPRPPVAATASRASIGSRKRAPQSRTSTRTRPSCGSPRAGGCRAGRRASRARQRWRTPRVVASISSHVVVDRRDASSVRNLAHDRASLRHAFGRWLVAMLTFHTFGVFPYTDAGYTREPCSTPRSMRVSRGTRPSASTTAVRIAPPTSTVSVLVASATGPASEVADRQQGERAHPLPGARARERVRRDLLGHGGVPEDVEQREADAGARRTSSTTSATGRPEREAHEHHRPDRDHEERGPHRVARAASGSRSAAPGQRARAVGGRDDAEHRRRSCRSPRRRSGRARTAARTRAAPPARTPTTVTHSQARERTSRKPSPSSASSVRRSLGAGGTSDVRTRASSSALTTKVAASSRNAQPAPRPSTSAVAIAGPVSSARLNVRLGERLRVLDLVRRHGARHEPDVGRLEERLRGAEAAPRSPRSARSRRRR